MFWFLVWPILGVVVGLIVVATDDDLDFEYSEDLIAGGVIGLFISAFITFLIAMMVNCGMSVLVDWDKAIEENDLKPKLTNYEISAEKALALADNDIDGSVQVEVKVAEGTTKRTKITIFQPVFVVKTDEESPKIQHRHYSFSNGWSIESLSHTRTYIYVPANEPEEEKKNTYDNPFE